MTATPVGGALERGLADLPASLTWLDGRRVTVGGATLDLAGGDVAATTALGALLYQSWYARAGVHGPAGAGDNLVEALRAAHADAARFEPGWRALRVSSAGRVLARRGGEQRLLYPVDFVCPARPGLPARPDEALLAVARRDSGEPVEGYWMTWGPLWPAADAPPLVRVYWNVAAASAPILVWHLTASLGALDLPWSLKLPADAREHARTDAAVLYLPRRDFAAAAPALRGVATSLADRLLDAEPPLTLRLAPGVALAEDPGGAESFGTNRCRLVAEAITAATGPAVPSPASLHDAVSARLMCAELDPERPYLEPGSPGDYAWLSVSPTSPPMPDRRSQLRDRTGPVQSPPAGDGFTAAAETIARRLVDEALWSGDRCTWVGDTLEPTDGGWEVVLRSCDRDVYAGTAGIAWFLARIGDPDTCEAAAGAARHALYRSTTSAPTRGGLYEGALGTVVAALDVAATLDDRDLQQVAAVAAEDALASATVSTRESDLLAGDAGVALAGLAIERATGSPAGLDVARAAGERLIETAQRTSAGWWWESPGSGAATGLCGLAHGGSGIAVALAALERRTGDVRFAHGTREALRWERRWYSWPGGGWPDLRAEASTGSEGEPGYPALWCHGAVGAGVARLVIHAWTGECTLLAEAGAAIQATRRATSAALAALARDESDAEANWSICHGLMGSVELLITAWEVLGHPDYMVAARRIGTVALNDGGDGAGPWRCGVPQGGEETPGLMLGLAGIGMTLLRLGDPKHAPSPARFGI